LPIPISIEEYNKVDEVNNPAPTTDQPIEETAAAEVSTPIVHITNVKVGNTVDIINGSLSGMNGVVKSIDTTKGTLSVELDMFGRMTNVDLGFAEVKLAE
jgi:transcriptional antiterminator NusG